MSNIENTFLETTITDIHQQMQRGEVTCEQLVKWYLDRIQRYDRDGPGLRAIVNTNPLALEQARSLDRHLSSTRTLNGPLHGIPVLVKDQAETDFAPTTFGSKAYEHYQPTRNATLIDNLIAAGAIVLAKTSMCDFAAGWFSFSSVTERTRNPYARDRDAGGSSAGTGAGVAANLGLVGIGEDTGGSIRIPSSFNNLFGLRVTTGLVSRTGFSPLLHFQDTPGPMARSVRDLAKLLDVIVGYDPLDAYTYAATLAPGAGRYEMDLGGRALRGLRVGIPKQALGPDDDDSRPVNDAFRAFLNRLGTQGVETVEIDIPDLQEWIVETSLYIQQSKNDINQFMATRTGVPKRTFKEIYDKRWFHPLNDLFHNLAAGPEDPLKAEGYYRQRHAQTEFRKLLLNHYAVHDLDFLMYPDVKVLPPAYADLESEKWSCLTFPTNTVIASQSHLPAMSIPSGFTQTGIPVGIEVVGKPYAETALLQFAYCWEALARPRRAPRLD
ncbi:MAG: amidase [Burkholderiales bacterium]